MYYFYHHFITERLGIHVKNKAQDHRVINSKLLVFKSGQSASRACILLEGEYRKNFKVAQDKWSRKRSMQVRWQRRLSVPAIELAFMALLLTFTVRNWTQTKHPSIGRREIKCDSYIRKSTVQQSWRRWGLSVLLNQINVTIHADERKEQMMNHFSFLKHHLYEL